jgi:hypothetical protein
MKTKPKLRARRMWANYYPDGRLGIYRTKRSATYFRGLFGGEATPVAVIPLHDVPKLTAKAKDAYVNACHAHVTTSGRMTYLLTAIGVLPRKGGRK